MGLLFSIAVTVIAIVETSKEEAALAGAEAADKRKAIAKKKIENTLNLLKNLGDMVTAS